MGEEGQEVIFTENTAPDREIWDEKGGLIKKGAAEIAERDQDHVPEVKVLTTLGMFAVPVTAETTIGEIRQKVQEWKPEYSLEQIELVCKDKDAWGPLFNKTSRPRDDDETVESLWSDWDIPRRMMQVALWIKEENEETGGGRAPSGRCSRSPSATTGASGATPSEGADDHARARCEQAPGRHRRFSKER